MTKKRWIGVLLTAVMVFAMGVSCFAADYEEIEPYIQPQECKVRVVDAKGNPVTNLCVENYKNDNTNPAKDYSKERWFAYTDLNGIATLCTFPETASDFFYVDNFHSFGNGDKHDFRTCEKVDGVYQVVWTHRHRLSDPVFHRHFLPGLRNEPRGTVNALRSFSGGVSDASACLCRAARRCLALLRAGTDGGTSAF